MERLFHFRSNDPGPTVSPYPRNLRRNLLRLGKCPSVSVKQADENYLLYSAAVSATLYQTALHCTCTSKTEEMGVKVGQGWKASAKNVNTQT